ncbi:hypothetical protein O181_027531 [Austropuccinia psidii MF-1]|uniref:Uncharacterized protein n=1 Tax=Austropuccinia psidii MF-1 TaxID=1389203 RepID=A0A9Q3CMI8_9BASI|nr:hypothetical protein [Austropuccinia psidii MF-1]
MVDVRKLGKIAPTLPLTFQFNRNLQPQDREDMHQVLQLHQLLQYLVKWEMENNSFKIESHWDELRESFQNICINKMPTKTPFQSLKGGIPTDISNSWRKRKPG